MAGNRDGLNRFDGTSFSPYYPSVADTVSFASNSVRSVTDVDGTRLAATTDSGGLFYFNLLQDTLLPLSLLQKSAHEAAIEDLHILTIHIQNDETIWVGTSDI